MSSRPFGPEKRQATNDLLSGLADMLKDRRWGPDLGAQAVRETTSVTSASSGGHAHDNFTDTPVLEPQGSHKHGVSSYRVTLEGGQARVEFEGSEDDFRRLGSILPSSQSTPNIHERAAVKPPRVVGEALVDRSADIARLRGSLNRERERARAAGRIERMFGAATLIAVLSGGLYSYASGTIGNTYHDGVDSTHHSVKCWMNNTAVIGLIVSDDESCEPAKKARTKKPAKTKKPTTSAKGKR